LAETGHALEQHVAAREHPDEDVVDDLAVADDDFFDLRAQLFERRYELSDAAVVGHRLSSPWMTSPGPRTPGSLYYASDTPNLTPTMRPASARQRHHGLTERPGAAPALPIHGAGILTFARIRGIGTASGSTVAGPLFAQHARGSPPPQALTGISRRYTAR